MSERSVARIARAEQAALDAREQMGMTLDEIQQKLSPANLISETGKGLRLKGLEMVDQLVASVSSRPVLATAAASGVGWLLSRKPALAVLLKLFLRSGATSRASAHSTSSKPQRTRRPRPRSRAREIQEETA